MVPHSVLGSSVDSSPYPEVPLMGGGIILFSRDTLTSEEIFDALLHASDQQISNVPPIKPAGGESYIIECPTSQDWACDQYQWVHKGKTTIKSTNGSEMIKNHFHIRMPGVKEGKGRSRPNSSNKFKRCAYHIPTNPKRVLVSYHGDDKVYVRLPHGNRKANEEEYLRTTKTVLNELKKTRSKPMTVYRNLSSKPNIEGDHHGILNPRNLRQVINHQALSREKGKLSKDDIYNLIQLAHHLDGFVAEITVYPDLLTIFALPEIMDTFIELLQSNADSPICLVYDTTFNLGDFYVSPLVFRHVLFENTPWIPLAFLIHDRKLQKCHNRLFEFLAERVPILKTKKIPFITDREPALTKAVERFFPNIQVLHCWNHLKRDFKEELRKLGADPSEIGVYLSDWRKMAQSEDESQFEESYKLLTAKWTESAKSYFDRHMRKDLTSYSGRWIIEQFPSLYDSYSGITNNPSESINAVLKRMTGWQELPVDSMMLSLFHLQNFYLVEIQRGRAGLGNYKLKSKFKEARLDKDEIRIPHKIVAPDEIIQYVPSLCLQKSHHHQHRS
nr:uncharacterized protein LOC117685662 [Crassostrea gigas]